MVRMNDDLRIDRRRQRADLLLSIIVQKVDRYIPREHRRDLYGELLELFRNEGVELLTDYDRQQMGLPPRDDKGWTMEEIMAYEQRRIDLMLKPQPPIFIERPTP